MNLLDRLTAAGFSITDTGGGCTAWRAELANGAYLLITDSGGCSAEIEGAPLSIGIYAEDGDVITQANDAANVDTAENTSICTVKRLRDVLAYCADDEPITVFVHGGEGDVLEAPIGLVQPIITHEGGGASPAFYAINTKL